MNLEALKELGEPIPLRSLQRYLRQLRKVDKLAVHGSGKATRYSFPWQPHESRDDRANCDMDRTAGDKIGVKLRDKSGAKIGDPASTPEEPRKSARRQAPSRH